MSLCETIGQNTLHYRILKGDTSPSGKYTQEALAADIGTDQARISRIENGNGNPSVMTIEKLCYILELHPFQLVTKVGEIKMEDLMSAEVLKDSVKELLHCFLQFVRHTDKGLLNGSWNDIAVSIQYFDALNVGLKEPDTDFTLLYQNFCKLFSPRLDQIKLVQL